MKKSGKNGWKRIWDRYNVLCSVLIMAAALGAAWILCSAILPHTRIDNDAPVVFTLAVAVISRVTRRMIYGIAASLIGTVTVNYFFTYPYTYFTLKIEGYTIDFVCFLAVSILVSLLTYQLRGETARAVRQERENYALYQRNLELEEKRAAAEIAAAKEKMHGNLLRAVSHDLRTPLTTIAGASALLMDKTAGLPEKEREQLAAHIHEESLWLTQMVENMLSVTRFQGEGKVALKKQEELVEEVLEESVTKFRRRFPDQKVNIRVPDEILLVPMDAMLIEQVLINLLENAVRHSGVRTPIEVTAERAGEAVAFTVRDHGRGIAPEDLPRLFDGSLRQSDGSRGLRIGLSTCMSIVAAHRGTLEARNHPAGGAEFRFTLPLAEDEAPPAADGKSQEEGTT